MDIYNYSIQFENERMISNLNLKHYDLPMFTQGGHWATWSLRKIVVIGDKR